MTTPQTPGFPTPPDPFQPSPAPAKRRKWPWIVGAIVLVLVLAAAFGGGESADTETTADTTTAELGTGEAPAAAAPATQTTIPPLTAAAPSGKGKTIVYEVISDSSSLNNVTYFDQNSAIQQETSPAAPWSLTVYNTSTIAIAGVTAQTDGLSVTCRVTVDGEVKDEQTSTGQYAVVNCNAPLF